MTPDLATFRALFREFESVADPVIDLYLDDASETLDMAAWGRCYAKAVLYYTAHELALANARVSSAAMVGDTVTIPQSGKLQSGSQGGISFSFEQSQAKSMSDEWLAQSPYGQSFAALRRQCLMPAHLAW